MFPQQPQQSGFMPMGAPQQPGPASAVQNSAPPVTIDAIVQFLRDDRMRGFKIDVEADSLIEADQDADKARRTEFVSSVGEFLGKVAPIAQQMPALAPMLGEMLKFAVRGFKVGQEIEDAIDKGMDAAGMALQHPPQKQPSPDELVKLQGIKAKVQAEIQKAQIDQQTAATDAQFKMQQMAMQAKAAEMDHQHAAAEHGMKMQGMQAQAALDQQAQQYQQQNAAADFAAQQAARVAPED